MHASPKDPGVRAERFAAGLFFLWSLVGSLVMAFDADAALLAKLGLPGWIVATASWILRFSDALWLSLAAALVFSHEARLLGARRAAMAFLCIALPSGAAEWIGTTTGLLFGHYTYSGQFGWRIAGILPFTIPLAWYAVVVGACRTLDSMAAWHWGARAAGCGILATLTDVNLEPVAIHVRGYWQWTDPSSGATLANPPVENYLTWFCLATMLAFAVPGHGKPDNPPPGSLHTAARLTPPRVLLLMNLLFFSAHLGRWLR